MRKFITRAMVGIAVVLSVSAVAIPAQAAPRPFGHAPIVSGSGGFEWTT